MPTVTAVTIVNISIENNAWWDDSFQFGTPGDTSWSFSNKTFTMDIKVNPTDNVAALALASPATITVTDPTQRILTMNVTDTSIKAALSPTGGAASNGAYNYDLIMTDGITGQRDMLMKGTITVLQGVTH